ncbi:MAG TPA: hypothetical protein VHM24_05590, partial [Gemmatimonadaceae bacterium]|nr:hypothetical protein [Gemmatimonadaceae bacterium]
MKTRLSVLAISLAAAAMTGIIAFRHAAASARLGQARAGELDREVAHRDVQISVWQKALAADSGSAIALGQLAGLHMQRARETGDESSYAKAEGYARRSVSLRTSRNGAAFVTLASSLLAQHEFVAADSIAEALVALEPDIPQYQALRGEIKLELGDYEAARRS